MFVIVDIEATGGSPSKNRIIEIAIFRHDGEKVVDSFNTLINPQKRIPPFITKLTGISNQMVSNAPTFAQVANEIDAICKDAIFVAHNVQFDYSNVRAAFRRLGRQFQRETLCTVSLSRKIIPNHESYNLGKLCRSLGIINDARHRATGDAKATVALLEYLMARDVKGFIQGSLANETLAKNIPDSIEPTTLYNLPEEVGIFYFQDANGKVYFIGKSDDIKHRVIQYYNRTDFERSKYIKMLSKLHDVSYELTGSKLIAALRERQEVMRLRPLHNRRMYSSRKMKYGLFKDYDENNYLRIFIKKLPQLGRSPFMVYPKKEYALKDVEERAKSHGLCYKLCDLDTSPPEPDCTYFAKGFCSGAYCKNTERVAKHNRRIKKAFKDLTYPHPNFMIVGQGRTFYEKSVVVIKDEKLLGYGYYQPEFTDNIEAIIGGLTLLEETPEYIRIINKHLHKGRSGGNLVKF